MTMLQDENVSLCANKVEKRKEKSLRISSLADNSRTSRIQLSIIAPCCKTEEPHRKHCIGGADSGMRSLIDRSNSPCNPVNW